MWNLMTTGYINIQTLIYVISMEFLSLSRKRSSARNVSSGEERGETAVFAGYHSFTSGTVQIPVHFNLSDM